MTHLCRFSAPVCRTFVLSLLTTNQPTNQRTQTIVYQNEYLKLHFCFPLLFCPPSKNYTIYTRPKIVAPVAGHMDSKFERYSDPHELRRTHRHHIPSPPVCVCVCVCQTNMCFDDLRHCESPMMMPASVPHTTYYIITVEKLANRRHKANSNKIV